MIACTEAHGPTGLAQLHSAAPMACAGQEDFSACSILLPSAMALGGLTI